MARILAPVWRRYNLAADDPQLAAPCQRHMHRAALTLALAETGLPCVELPAAMNYQINTAQLVPPPGFAETDPAIIHYHHLATEDGFLLACPYPRAQERRSGTVLHESVAPASARTWAVLAGLAHAEKLAASKDAMREQVVTRDRLLLEVFGSRTWRIGHAATGLLRFLRRGNRAAVSAEDRWRELPGRG